jgi:hypothetical protein
MAMNATLRESRSSFATSRVAFLKCGSGSSRAGPAGMSLRLPASRPPSPCRRRSSPRLRHHRHQNHHDIPRPHRLTAQGYRSYSDRPPTPRCRPHRRYRGLVALFRRGACVRNTGMRSAE